jgi:hypothetical protein
MKSASNMIAKWYQNDIHEGPNARENICAIPTAKVGAPPTRPNMVFSPMLAASAFIPSTVTAYRPPSTAVIVAATCSGDIVLLIPALIAK